MKTLKIIWQTIIDIGTAGGEKVHVDPYPPLLDNKFRKNQ